MKCLLITVFSVFLIFKSFSQCNTNYIPAISSSYSSGKLCYIDGLDVDGITISNQSGYESVGNSYQMFSTPLINLNVGGQHNFTFNGHYEDYFNIALWVDFNGDGVYGPGENAGVFENSTSVFSYFSVNVPFDAIVDTVNIRVVKQVLSGGYGYGIDDACNVYNAGEVEDYRAVISCTNLGYLSYDPNPYLCYDNMVELTATTMLGDILWFTDTNNAPITTGEICYLNLPSYTNDTIIYIQNVYGNCTDLPYEIIDLILLPIPQATINGPDTVFSCSAHTFTVTPGPYELMWSTGETDPSITIDYNFGGYLNLVATDMYTNCYSLDRVWVGIAPDSVSSYAHIDPSYTFCSDRSIFLRYDSLVNPGVCTWYTYPSNTLIGSNSEIFISNITSDTLQYIVHINSMCGTDTTLIRRIFSPQPSWDSLYVPQGVKDINGIYTACYSGNVISIVISGLQGSVYQWQATDLSLSYWIGLNGGDTISMPAGLMQSGHVYAAYAEVMNSEGCMVNSDTVYIQPANTIYYNFPDTMWMCNFPNNIGIPAVNYGIYDILWSTGDTTNTIFVSQEGPYSITTIDHQSGCVNSDHTYVKDGNTPGPFHSVTYVCDGQAFFEFPGSDFQADYWTEFDDSWVMINETSGMDYVVYNQGFNEYLVVIGFNQYGCEITDTTLIDFSGDFSFSLGNDVNVSQSSYTIAGPTGYSSYLWNPSGQTTASLTINVSGTYLLTIDNGQGCTYTDTINVTLNPTSIDEFISSNILIYPNPAKDFVTIDLNDYKIGKIEMTDITGRLVRSFINQNENKVTIDISDLPDGIYFTEIFSDERIIKVKLVVSR